MPGSSHAVSAVPMHSCAVVPDRPGRCPALSDVKVQALALSGRHVGLVVTTSTCDCDGHASLLVLADMHRPGARVLGARFTGGFTEIDYVGLSFDDVSLYATESCTASDGNGCRRHRILVRAPLAGGPPQTVPVLPVFAYARTRGHQYAIPQAHCSDAGNADPGAPTPACRIVELP